VTDSVTNYPREIDCHAPSAHLLCKVGSQGEVRTVAQGHGRKSGISYHNATRRGAKRVHLKSC